MAEDDFSAERTRLGLSQRGLAAKLGMSATTIGHYEHGRRKVPQCVKMAMLALWHRLETQGEPTK